MKEFVFLFRMDIAPGSQPSPEQMQLYMNQWTKWLDEIRAEGNLAEGGNHFLRTGKVVRPGSVIEDMPYTRQGESVAGYTLIRAPEMADAVSIAKKCPILRGEGTSVEIRETANPGS